MNRIVKLYPNSAILIRIHLKTQMSKYSVFDLYAVISLKFKFESSNNEVQ